MINLEENTEISTTLKELRNDAETSVKDVQKILNSAEYDLNELKDIDDPKILVLGTGPFLPEAQIISKWAEGNKKGVTVDCVDKEEIDANYINLIFGLKQSTQYFKMNMINSTFEDSKFGEYDLVLLLRYPDLSNINENVFKKIGDSLRENGSFIMSGGLNNRFGGEALATSGLTLEKKAQVSSHTDFYKVYVGENTVINLRKVKK